MESLRDVKRKMERELAKGKITPLKLEKMEILESDYKEISSYEQCKNVLNWLLRLSEFKTGEATVLNNIYLNPVRGKNEFVRTKTSVERMQIFHKIERTISKINPAFDGDVRLESDEGLDYSIFDANYHLLDGGVITDPDITIQEALKQIIDDMGGGSTPPMAVDYERLSDETDEVAQADMEAGVKALQDAERPDRALDEGSVSQPDVSIVSKEALEEQQPSITFVVAECSEFHNLGELHEGVATMEEAIALWEDIPAERMNGIKSIGIECVDSSGETLDVDIVIGNKIDLVTLTYVPEIYENEQALDMIAQLIDHYLEMEVIGDIPEKIEQRLEALYEQNMDPADKLAAEIDAFMYDFNPYEYNDQVDDRKAQVDTISKDLQSGEAGYITSYLQEIVTQGAGTTEDQLKAQELMSKIQEYKPLAKVEEMEEQNYNQIDNVLNNGFEQKKEEKEKEARGEDKSDKRPSLKKRLDEKKELVASEPGKPALDKDKSKKKTEELS